MGAAENTSMPAVVREYASWALRGKPLQASRTVRVTQVGEMMLKPGASPRHFEAREEFAIGQVAFAWHARFPMLGPFALRVTDSYDGHEGRLEVRLLGIPVQRRQGPELAQGEAYRYLAEIAWVPHAILANRQLEWRELDGRTVEVTTLVAGERIAVRLSFNENGEIVSTEAERPRLEAGNAVTPWIGHYSDYQDLGGVRVPTRGEVRWDLPEGPFTYWRGRITSLELD
ncbi:MAG TPA: DUF6544 family protein [Solirubrobacteraceae bacterium]